MVLRKNTNAQAQLTLRQVRQSWTLPRADRQAMQSVIGQWEGGPRVGACACVCVCWVHMFANLWVCVGLRLFDCAAVPRSRAAEPDSSVWHDPELLPLLQTQIRAHAQKSETYHVRAFELGAAQTLFGRCVSIMDWADTHKQGMMEGSSPLNHTLSLTHTHPHTHKHILKLTHPILL